jgi:hypothetical protein
MERKIKNINETYVQSEVNYIYIDGKIIGAIIAKKGFYKGDSYEAVLMGERKESILQCDDMFYYNVCKHLKFECADNQCKIYINNQLFAFTNDKNQLINTDSRILCQSKYSDSLGLAMASVFLFSDLITEIDKETFNEEYDKNFSFCAVKLSEYALVENNKRELEYKRKQEDEKEAIYIKKMQEDYQREQIINQKRIKIILAIAVIAFCVIFTIVCLCVGANR